MHTLSNTQPPALDTQALQRSFVKALQRGGYVQPALPGKNALVIIAPLIKEHPWKTLPKLSLAATAVHHSLRCASARCSVQDKTVTLVAALCGGGPTDRVARDLAEALRSPPAGVSVVVDNAAGAGSTIGTAKGSTRHP